MCTGATPRREYEISMYDIPCVTTPMRRQYYGILHIFHFHEKAKIDFLYNGRYKGHIQIIISRCQYLKSSSKNTSKPEHIHVHYNKKAGKTWLCAYLISLTFIY